MFYGIYGYFVDAITRVGFSVWQVLAVLVTIVGVGVIHVFMMRGAESRGAIRWGQMPPPFPVRALHPGRHVHLADGSHGLRPERHPPALACVEVVRDTSIWAATPALGYAAIVISACVMIFFTFVAFIFWLGGLAEKPSVPQASADASPSTGGPELAPAAGD